MSVQRPLIEVEENAMKIDLHCHSNLSDGELSPQQLVRYAGEQGIEMLAITDHDLAEPLPEANAAADALAIQLVPGIELSANWGNVAVHVLGLNINPVSAALGPIVERQAAAREQRALEIGERLAKLNIQDSYQGAKAQAGTSRIGRPHFARFLVESGVVKDVKTAYKKYLGAGKVGDVKTHWPAMEEAVQWVHQVEGYAVLAHPAKYNLTRRKLDRLCEDFKEAGGDGLELVSGMQTADITAYHHRLCEKYELYASCGSDFHGPVSSWHDLGKMAPVPGACRMIWECWA